MKCGQGMRPLLFRSVSRVDICEPGPEFGSVASFRRAFSLLFRSEFLARYFRLTIPTLTSLSFLAANTKTAGGRPEIFSDIPTHTGSSPICTLAEVLSSGGRHSPAT